MAARSERSDVFQLQNAKVGRVTGVRQQQAFASLLLSFHFLTTCYYYDTHLEIHLTL